MVSWSVALLRRVVGSMGGNGSKADRDVVIPPDAISRKLVRDPVCGMHMAETIAIPLRESASWFIFVRWNAAINI